MSKQMKKTLTLFLISCAIWAQASSLVVFNGTSILSGGSWSSPENSVSMKVTDNVKFNDASTLQLQAKCQNWWGGGGWNWKNWQKPGDDSTRYKALSFWIKKSAGQLRDVWVQLGDSENSVSSQVNIVENGYSDELGNDFVRVVIPLERFTGNFERKSLASINMTVVPVSEDGAARLILLKSSLLMICRLS